VLRKLWVLLWPLFVTLIVYSGVMVAISLFALLVYFAVGSNVGEGSSAAWVQVRPAFLSGATLFAVLAVVRWALHAAELRRKLHERRISLREYSGWPAQKRSAWLKGGGQT
jgi:hypothetical protein